MAETFKKLDQRQLPTTTTTLYTAPTAPGSTVVKCIRVVNVDTAASHNFTLYQSGTGAANQILGTTSLGPGETFIDVGPIILGSADTIAGKADTASVMTCTISGLEVT